MNKKHKRTAAEKAKYRKKLAHNKVKRIKEELLTAQKGAIGRLNNRLLFWSNQLK